jgi:hypothetical protein
MRHIRLAALLPVLLLAACYSSEKEIFSIADGRLPLPAGTYSSSQNTVFDISIRDGHYSMPNGLSTSDVVLVPLSGRDGTYIVERGESGGFSYSLIRVMKNGRGFELLKPDCEQGPDRAAAQGFAEVGDGSCKFNDVSGLTAAMRKLNDSSSNDRWVTYIRS